MGRKVLGLEIRETAVTAVLLECGFKGCTLLDQLFAPIIPDDEGDDGLAKAIDFLVERLKPVGATCVLGVPTSFLSFRNLSVPFNDQKKIRQMLPFELEASLPVPVEELVFDFEAVKNENGQDLLAFIAEKEKLHRYLALLEAVNLHPVQIMPAGYAATRVVAGMMKHDNDYLFIDTGEKQHTIYAISSGHVRMVRTFPVGAGGYPVLRSLETAVKRTLAALSDSTGITFNPWMVYAMGPKSDLLTSGKEAPRLLGIPVNAVEVIRTFPRMTGVTNTPQWISGRLDIALALALMESESIGGINFSTQRTTLQYYWGEYRKSILVSAVMVFLVVVALLAGQFTRVNAKERQLADLNNRIETVFKDTFPEVSRIVDPLQQMKVKIMEAGKDAGGMAFSASHVRVIDILDTLSRKIPASLDVAMNRMVVGMDNVMISGDTLNFNTVDDMKGRLEGSEIFKSVTISSADLDKSGKRVRFKLRLDF